jgi:hypothetical protein
MQNNIYVVSVIFILFIILFMIFVQTRNLENYKNVTRNAEATISSVPINSYNNMYLNSCDNECNNNPACNFFTSTADMTNTNLGNCLLYNTFNASNPRFSATNNIYYKN